MEDLTFERFEYKYFVSDELAGDIRHYIAPYLRLDRHCADDPERTYTVTNLYWDNPAMDLYWDHMNGSIDRFKLRIRTYGRTGGGPTSFFEVKRKVRQVIAKSRAAVPRALYQAVLDGDPTVTFDSAEQGHLDDFIGRVIRYGCAPVLLIRYEREAYENVFDEDARLTFDRGIRYQPAYGNDLRGTDDGWTYIDDPSVMAGVPSGSLIELKFGSFVPEWLFELVERFQLRRVQFSKYLAATTHFLEHEHALLDDGRRGRGR